MNDSANDQSPTGEQRSVPMAVLPARISTSAPSGPLLCTGVSLALSLFALVLSGCAPEPEAPLDLVVWFEVDTLRADALGCYGHGQTDDGGRGVSAEIDRMANEGWQFEAADASFDLLVDRCAGSFQPRFEKLAYNVAVESREDAGNGVRTEATVKLAVGDTVRHEVAEGDGPVNALDAALRKALEVAFPVLAQMHLLDYKVRVINAQEGTAAKVRVSIESTDGERVWGTVGVSENVIEASWLALADSFHHFLTAVVGTDAQPQRTAVPVQP